MAKLTDEEKLERKRQRMAEHARRWTIGTHAGKVAKAYQKMVRAEYAARPAGLVPAVVNGEVVGVFRRLGQCVCVTCGKVGPWKGNSAGGGPIETGHFVPGRRASVLFEPHNAHPQCKSCNQHLGGNQANYKLWIEHVYGADEEDRLRRLKNESRRFTREELVDMQLAFQARLKAAEDTMKQENA